METPPINEEDNMIQYDDLFVGSETLWNFKGAENFILRATPIGNCEFIDSCLSLVVIRVPHHHLSQWFIGDILFNQQMLSGCLFVGSLFAVIFH